MNTFWRGRPPALIVSVFLIMVTSSASTRPAPDLPGPYCGARAPQFQCCEGRSDSCSVPILGTLCYCDKFCKNTTNDDCCPDYDNVCAREPMPATQILSCSFNGQIYTAGQSFRHNCNSCTCTQTGEICCDQTLCVTDAHLLKRLRGMSSILGWYPRNHTQFWGRKYLETVTQIANTEKPDSQGNKNILRARKHAAYLASHKPRPKAIPIIFDARYAWPDAISPIANQGFCNTAWAHSTVSTASDRLRIQSCVTNVQLSTEQMIDCSHSRQNGCWGGGKIDRAWNYLRKKGLHSTRHYNRETEYKCSNSTKKYRRYKSGPMYLTVGEANIQQEIMISGPVQATMRVYRDFFSYGEGIYRSSDSGEGDRSGFLAVKIIGWGVERGVKYWIAANSWGTEWGEDGYFRIRRGTNECRIEDFIFAAWGTPVRPSTRITEHEDATNDINDSHTLKVIAGPPGRRKAYR